MKLDLVRLSFARYFEAWGITLPDEVPERGSIKSNGWWIDWSITDWGFEFRCGHRMTNERYVIIREDGTPDNRAALYQIDDPDFYPSSASREELAEAKKKRDEHNAMVREHFHTRGL